MAAVLKPQLAQTVDSVPQGQEWLYEYKYDGYRILAEIRKNRVRLLSRNGLDWTERFSAVADDLKMLNRHAPLTLDGELVVVNRRGIPDFQRLQRVLDAGEQISARYVVFDVLHARGRDVRHLSLANRKELLQEILPNKVGTIGPSDWFKGEGERLLARACKAGYEGIVAKRADAPYVGRRGPGWVKCRCSHHEELLVLGYTEHSAIPGQIGALLLGLRVAGRDYLFCGRVGTGFSSDERVELYAQLFTPRSANIKILNPRMLPRGAKLVAPKLVAEIHFTEWTAEGLLRHPSYMGLRRDKSPKEVLLTTSSHPFREAVLKQKEP